MEHLKIILILRSDCKYMRLLSTSLFVFALITNVSAQTDRWQQRVEYKMDINFDVSTHQFTGDQKIVYFNNSPDTLSKVFYHLYFNAFQPGSMMDVRSRILPDPDNRIRDRISYLEDFEVGYHKINSLKQNGKKLDYHIEGTTLEVELDKPILPGKKSTFTMKFESQVPIQIRRSGRNNKEGIDYSMAQWYPKLAEYDYEGWHANPYVAREFYGVWGDFDIKITIDSSYLMAATGHLQNPEAIGHGYPSVKKINRKDNKNLTWHWKAENVHDFVWTADRDYTHDIIQVPDGPELHFFYQKDTLVQNWKELQPMTIKAFQFMNQTFGKYPYKKYSVIQGGDGGMEYPMATLVTGRRSLSSLVSVTVHEALHSWYQMILGTNESLYPWMDEGFTSFASAITKHHIYEKKSSIHPLAGSYNNYFALVKSGKEEPLSTHADHYSSNAAYGVGAYSKGAISLNQLCYILGKSVFYSGLRRYYNEWKFKHPNATDFKRVMEKHSGLELDWYFEYFINTTHYIDYAIKSVQSKGGETEVLIEKIGKMPMPVELFVEYENGEKVVFYIPLSVIRGEKLQEIEDFGWSVYSDWPWTHPYYKLTIPGNMSSIKHMEIDATQRIADIDRSNNVFPFGLQLGIEGKKKN